MEMDPYSGYFVPRAEKFHSLPAQVLTVCRCLQSRDIDFRFFAIKLCAGRQNLQHIAESDRIKNGFEIMVSVPAPAEDP
jgi:hypothetical protein